MTIRVNIRRKVSRDKRNGMIMNTAGGGKSLGSGKYSLVIVYDILEVRMHRGWLNFFNGMEFGNNTQMTFFEDLFHVIATYDLRRSSSDSLELINVSLMLELHC
jgi:hypothetical protein